MYIMIPSNIHPFLWSYDVDKIDLERDKKIIITNVLNFGTDPATKWLFEVYSREDIGCMKLSAILPVGPATRTT